MRREIVLSVALALVSAGIGSGAGQGGELRFSLRSEPKTFDPLLVQDEPSEIVRYLTGGVLIRMDRRTQQPVPELAASWKRSPDGRRVTFQLRKGLSYSDGSPFDAQDVAHTFRRLADPALRSPVADSFRNAAGEVRVEVTGAHQVTIVFPAVVAGMERLFDGASILSSRSPLKELAALGPFHIAEHKSGVHILLRRNPRYWKRDEAGNPLPYLDGVLLEILQNRDLELLRFRRGQLHLISPLEADLYEELSTQMKPALIDAGPLLDADFLWFNQVPSAPVEDHKKAWFTLTNFRRAVSGAINREDLCRVAYRGHAQPAAGPVSPSNRFWYNSSLRPHPYQPAESLKLLARDGFRLEGGTLRDRQGRPVEFSLITNAGNRGRERMGALIQQDLARIGIKVQLVTLDFRSLIERITRTFQYDACLLGFVNTELDPDSQKNVWLSSGSSHQWNPNQKSPATPWEAEIDRWMTAQASAPDLKRRKASFDKVQQIVWEQVPFIYLVHKNALAAVSPALRNVTPSILFPQIVWNAERLSLAAETSQVR